MLLQCDSVAVKLFFYRPVSPPIHTRAGAKMRDCNPGREFTLNSEVERLGIQRRPNRGAAKIANALWSAVTRHRICAGDLSPSLANMDSITRARATAGASLERADPPMSRLVVRRRQVALRKR